MIIAGTGHRPQKLGGFQMGVNTRLLDLALVALKRYRPEKVISGMALGWDMALADMALFLSIPLIAAVPFAGQEKKWPTSSQESYRRILEHASEVVVVSEGGFSARAMQKRNEWMVDHADFVLALWDGSSGGTGNCTRYIEQVNKPYKNLWNSWIKYK